MTKPGNRSLQNSVAFAAAVAALGVSVGVTVENARAAGPQGKGDTVQYKHVRERGAAATQSKIEASRMKEREAGRGAINGPGSSRMLNPQPLPPKPAFGAPGELVPAVKKQ